MGMIEWMEEYPDWVASPYEEILKNIVKKDLMPVSREEYLNLIESFFERYKESDETDVGSVYLETAKDFMRKRIERDTMDEIEKFHNRLSELQESLGNVTIEKAFANPLAKTDLEKKESIKKALFGILFKAMLEELWRVFAMIGYDSIETLLKFSIRIVLAVLEKNDYKYNDVDLSKELKGKTLDEARSLLLEAGKDEDYDDDDDDEDKDRGLAWKFNKCSEEIMASMTGCAKEISSLIVARDGATFVDRYLKDELNREITSEVEGKKVIETIIAGLKHVEPNEGRKEAEWTDTELRAKKLIEAVGDNEELLRKIEEMVKENK